MNRMKKIPINESLPKSVRERLYDRLRNTCKGTGRKSLEIARKERSMMGKMLPKKPADHTNVPKFRQKKRISKMAEEDKNLLSMIVGQLISVSMGGWHEENDRFVNESGRSASAEYWRLEDGQLILKESEKIKLDTDRLHDFRQQIESKSDPEIDARIEEALGHIKKADQIIHSLPRNVGEVDQLSVLLENAESLIGELI